MSQFESLKTKYNLPDETFIRVAELAHGKIDEPAKTQKFRENILRGIFIAHKHGWIPKTRKAQELLIASFELCDPEKKLELEVLEK